MFVSDLKRAVLCEMGYPMEYDIEFLDSVTGQLMTDENCQIYKNASVLVRRIPKPRRPSQKRRRAETYTNRGVPRTVFSQDDFSETMKRAHSEDVLRSSVSTTAVVPDELLCSLSNELLDEPVTLLCCMKKCSAAVVRRELVANQSTCPFCKKNCGVDDLFPDDLLRRKVTKFLNEQRVRPTRVVVDDIIRLPSNNVCDAVLNLQKR